MSESDRVCQRAGCRTPACVTLTFHYDARQASLTDLVTDRHPTQYDLCAVHADVLIVPRGWERLDRRSPTAQTSVTTEPPPARRRTAAEPAVDRYAALTAQLPRLAAAFNAAMTARDAVDPSGAGDATSGADAVARVGSGTASAVERAASGPYEPVTGPLPLETERVLDGQLQMPIASEPDGVVVALTRTRRF